jgi:hypothetical protein
MSNNGNLYDLVEHAAVRPGCNMPRLELWQKILKAVEQKQLQVGLGPEFQRPPGWPNWITNVRAAVERGFDPGCLPHILRKIPVSIPDFDNWLHSVNRIPRGPELGTTGLREADRKVFAEIVERIRSGGARSPYGAALAMAREGTIAGNGTPESKAKRVSALYRRERGSLR